MKRYAGSMKAIINNVCNKDKAWDLCPLHISLNDTWLKKCQLIF